MYCMWRSWVTCHVTLVTPTTFMCHISEFHHEAISSQSFVVSALTAPSTPSTPQSDDAQSGEWYSLLLTSPASTLPASTRLTLPRPYPPSLGQCVAINLAVFCSVDEENFWRAVVLVFVTCCHSRRRELIGTNENIPSMDFTGKSYSILICWACLERTMIRWTLLPNLTRQLCVVLGLEVRNT